MEVDKPFAQLAYEAYGESVGWKNYQGGPMPAWRELPPAISKAWGAAAVAVVAKTLESETGDQSE